MPYILPGIKERALSNAERERRLSKIEAEQSQLLRRALGDEFFEYLEEFDEPTNEWLRRVKQANKTLIENHSY